MTSWHSHLWVGPQREGGGKLWVNSKIFTIYQVLSENPYVRNPIRLI